MIKIRLITFSFDYASGLMLVKLRPGLCRCYLIKWIRSRNKLVYEVF